MQRPESSAWLGARQRLRRRLAGLHRTGATAWLVPLAAAALLAALPATRWIAPGPILGSPASMPPHLGAPALAAPPPSRPLAGMARAVDGDTLDLAGQRIRLHGIDAPESQQTCQLRARSYACGQEAERRLAAAIAGRAVRCVGRGTDRYGRILAVCHAGAVDLAEAMVRSGWAVAYRRYGEDYAAAEAEARASRSGLWAGSFEAPEDWRRAHPRN